MHTLRRRIRHVAVSLMLAAMTAFVAHGLALGSAHAVAAVHGHGFVASQAADHAQETGAVPQHQDAGDLSAADDGDGSERSAHAHCPLCCAGTCAVALPDGSSAFNLLPFRIGVVRFESEAGHGIDPDSPRRPPRATSIA